MHVDNDRSGRQTVEKMKTQLSRLYKEFGGNRVLFGTVCQGSLYRFVFLHELHRRTETLSRVLELVTAVVLAAFVTVPVFLLFAVSRYSSGKGVFEHVTCIGKGGEPIHLTFFRHPSPIVRSLALFPYVIGGKLALIGPALTPWEEMVPRSENGYIYTLKPGIMSLWQLRKNSAIGHEGRLATNWEYCFTRSSLRDILLIFRILPSSLIPSSAASFHSRPTVLDISFHNTTMQRGVAYIAQAAEKKEETTTAVYFINADCLNKTANDDEYRMILQSTDLVFPDGIGLVLAGKMAGSPLKENINGTDMLPFICQLAVRKELKIFLLGGRPGVAEKMRDNLKVKYGSIIAGVHHGYIDHALESSRVVDLINSSKADIVLVALGAPLQEKWIEKYKSNLSAGVAIGVGGLFDFYSGNTRRAPRWLREIGLEWVYRIIQEPGRMWKRYVIGNPLFLARVWFWLRQNSINSGE